MRKEEKGGFAAFFSFCARPGSDLPPGGPDVGNALVKSLERIRHA